MAEGHGNIAEPFISWRDYIHWASDAQPSEPTSTLVLTSRQRRFVDVRILKPTSSDEPDLPNEGGPLSRLDWAFAGVSKTSYKPAAQTSQSASQSNTQQPSANIHCVWHHWIDSRAPPLEDDQIRDEGDISPQPDGWSLEIGHMVNPATGKDEQYEECWTDEEVVQIAGEPARRSVVLGLHETDAHGRVMVQGLVVRVGSWVQGIIKVIRDEAEEGQELEMRSEISCERWGWSKDEGWMRRVKIGRLWLPCALTWQGKLKLGGEIRYGDFEWTVDELDSW